MKKTGIKEIAAEAGVSPATVSRVLNNSPRISRDVTQRVLAVARRLEYLPHTPLTKVIALLITGFYSYESSILCAIQAVAAERKFRLELILPDAPDTWSERLYMGGISFVPMSNPPSGFPIVTINHAPDPLNGVYSVASDDVGAVMEAVRRFREAGHSRIGYLLAQDSDHYNNRQRTQAYRDACRMNFLNPCCEVVKVTNAAVENALVRLMKKGITALIYLVPIRINTQELFSKLKIRIPQDLSLIVWEALGMPPNYRPAHVYTIQDGMELARNAIDLLERIAQKKEVPQQILVPYLWVNGRSIRKPRKQN